MMVVDMKIAVDRKIGCQSTLKVAFTVGLTRTRSAPRTAPGQVLSTFYLQLFTSLYAVGSIAWLGALRVCSISISSSSCTYFAGAGKPTEDKHCTSLHGLNYPDSRID